MPSNFAFLKESLPQFFASAARAEVWVTTDPQSSCIKARIAAEQMVEWLYDVNPDLPTPTDAMLVMLLKEPKFRRLVGDQVAFKLDVVRRVGNRAAHQVSGVTTADAMESVSGIFHFAYWLARTYGGGKAPDPGIQFDPALVPETKVIAADTLKDLLAAAKQGEAAEQQFQQQVQEQAQVLAAKDHALAQQVASIATLDEEKAKLVAELELLRAAAAKGNDAHDYKEADTREYLIDELLREAGWQLADTRDREFPVKGCMPDGKDGFVDYVLWGDNGKPLALVEAKRTRRSVQAGMEQARYYADGLEKIYGQRPVMFLTNGYQHRIWDDRDSAPREVVGFYAKPDLELVIQRRARRRPLAATPINSAIADRHYQQRAIARVAESFETQSRRKALLVMATGAGKTRTVIGLADIMINASWAKRVLFLADRTALVRQAVGAFKRHLPSSAPVNLVTEKTTDGRVFVSTYPSMLNLLDQFVDGQRMFSVGFFDLIVVDEAHRSIFHKYKAVLDYFDARLVGLTATPKDDVDRSTYTTFDLRPGEPTDNYPLEQAVREGYLVPPAVIKMDLKFQRRGIRYDELSEEEKDLWDELDWSEDGTPVPDHVEAEAINKWLFNTDTVDKVLTYVMDHGHKVAGGDRLAKTIIFAKNQQHAEFIVDRFNTLFPESRGTFARVITHAVEYATQLIDDFSTPEKSPHIAVSVDMLDTGIDVPEVANLVFFKAVYSKTKFWQMIGRGTRLSADLFGPGQDKKDFRVFDFCGNFDFFGEHPDLVEASVTPSISERVFRRRLELLGLLDTTEVFEETDQLPTREQAG